MSIKRKPTDPSTPVMLFEALSADDWVTIWAESTKTGHRMQVSTLRAWLASQPLMSPAPAPGRVLVANGEGGLADGGTLLEDIASGGGGAMAIRFITEGTSVGEAVLYATVDADLNNGVVVPFLEGQHALALPSTSAPIGTTLTVIHGDPAEPLFNPPYGTPGDLLLGILDDQYAEHLSLAVEGDDFAVLPHGQTATLVKTNEINMGPQTYHIWKVLSEAGGSGAGSGAGGGGNVARWDPYGYDLPDEGRYSDLSSAVVALSAVGGGTLEVSSGEIYATQDMSNIDLVGVGGFAALTFYYGARFNNLRSATGVQFRTEYASGQPVLQGPSAITLTDCDVGTEYTSDGPFITSVERLLLKGSTRVGAGTVLSYGGMQVHAHDTSEVATDALTAAYFDAYIYGSAYVSPDQAGVSGYKNVFQVSMERFLPFPLSATGAPSAWANRFVEADTTGGPITVPVSASAGLAVTQVGARAWVAKRNDGGDVTITGLTYVPGGGTTYVITEEDAVVELLWLPGGVQVKP